MTNRARNASLVLALVVAALPARAAAFELKYLYDLATLTGNIKINGFSLAFDPEAREIFALGYGAVRIFNQAGIQTYQFRGDDEFGNPIGVAPLEDGELVLLSYREGKWSLVRANFRGEPQELMPITGLPASFPTDFNPGEIAFAKGKIHLADMPRMRVLVLDEHGAYVTSYDLAALLDVEQKRADLGLNGFNVDREGNILFTVAPLFKAYTLSPTSGLRTWGTPGGAPGKFNIVAGIAADDQGRIYVVDMLKCAVITFDRDLNFIGEFGYRGYSPGRLIAPRSVAVGNGNVYVAQYGGRGVTVFKVAE
jgi:hypothetical protein